MLENQVRGTQVRVHAGAATGSGTVIYSKPAKVGYSSYILTCHHVVEGLIKVEKEWDPTLGRERKVEHRQTTRVEFFEYENVEHGKPPVTAGVPGHVVAYDKTHDMAIIHMGTLKEYPHVANLPAEDLIQQIRIGDDVWACGCGLALDPITTHGILNHMGYEIDYKDYWGSSALITFGNSGGGAFWKDGEKFWFIGVPSRVAIQGWGDVANHIGFFSPVRRVYKFLDEQFLHFLIPGHPHGEDVCLKEIEDRKRAEELRLKSLLPDTEGKESQ
jgi:S1-C subfamily serine protease